MTLKEIIEKNLDVKLTTHDNLCCKFSYRIAGKIYSEVTLTRHYSLSNPTECSKLIEHIKHHLNTYHPQQMKGGNRK